MPVIGVIEPGARAAVAATGGGARRRHRDRRHHREQRLRPRHPRAAAERCRWSRCACPLFVPFVEEGWFDHPATELVAREYLAPLQAAQVDVLVLGCTHYPLLKPLLGARDGARRCG